MIEINSLTKKYSDSVVVKGLNLQIQSGEFLTLLGPSGSGKTTTLRMVAGLEKPDLGSIKVNEIIFNDSNVFVPTHKRNIGMVFQSYALWPHKSIYENVAFPLRMRNISKSVELESVHQMLDLVGLQFEVYGQRYPSQLSGGQQQRVSLARALVSKPQVLLYDEPLSNLDARLRESMRLLMRKIHNELKVTSIFVTHDQMEAMVLSDRICVMNSGEIVQDCTPSVLFEKPNNLFVAEFIGQANILPINSFNKDDLTVNVGNNLILQVNPDEINTKKSGSVVIRYHQVKIIQKHNFSNHNNQFQGKIITRLFLGDRVQYQIKLQENYLIICEVNADDGLASVGEDIYVQLPIEHLMIL